MNCKACDQLLKDREEVIDERTGELNTMCSRCLRYAFPELSDHTVETPGELEQLADVILRHNEIVSYD